MASKLPHIPANAFPTENMSNHTPEKIIIVGGGAGGLELASRLGRRLGPEQVTLVDQNPFHIWKPSLHEVAAGTLDIHQEGLSYSMLAHDNGFQFAWGAMLGLDPEAKTLRIDGTRGSDGLPLLPARTLSYDRLVLAMGSVSNYFGVKGAEEHCISLDQADAAESFRLRLLRLLVMAESDFSSGDAIRPIHIVIVGAGATGIELAAELRDASNIQAHYGLQHLVPERDLQISILEGAPHILSPLNEKISIAATRLLQDRAIEIHTNCQVTEVTADHVKTQGGRTFSSDLTVWAAGIQGSRLLNQTGLPCGPSGRLQVDANLHVTGYPNIYALGDCAACPGADGRPLPPRAQTAHQQASYLYRALKAVVDGGAWPTSPYVYKDHGSLVSIGTQTAVGNLMGGLFRHSNWFIQGMLARTMYASLHLLHHATILGWRRTAVLAMARFLVKRTKPRVKLH